MNMNGVNGKKRVGEGESGEKRRRMTISSSRSKVRVREQAGDTET